MAKRKTFGKTWWGQQWIDAMEKIDYNTNRLPRGRRYANNGSVKEISIEKAMVRAKVKGSLPSPYSVKIALKQFNKTKISEIKNLIQENPVIAAELSLGKLPQSLFDQLVQIDIRLLPEDWKDLNSTCSCPDDANPCKHIAAVYYLISDEVDKDPFFLFNMRGLATNVLTGTQSDKRMEKSKKDFQEYFLPFSRVKGEKNIPEEFDLSLSIPEQDIESIFSLLPDTPLFYDAGDFKKILKKAYKTTSKNAEFLTLEEEFPDLRNFEIRLIFSYESFPAIRVFVNSDKFSALIVKEFKPKTISLTIPVRTGKKIQFQNVKGVVLGFTELLEFFQSHPVQTDRGSVSDSLRFFSLLSGLALSFVRSRSFFPELVQNAEQGYYIRYTPNIHDEKILKLFLRLEDFFPIEIGFLSGTTSILDMKSVTELVSIFISETFRNLLKNEPGFSEDKLLFSFFGKSSLYTPDKFSERTIGKGIGDWLERLSTLNSNINPVIKIGQTPEKMFQLSIEVENRNSAMEAMVPLAELFGSRKEFFNTPAEILRTRLSRQIALAGEFIPELNEVLGSRGLISSGIDMKRIGKFLTEYATLLAILKIKFILPKSLQELLKPEIRIAASAKKTGNVVKYLDLNEILQFSWKVALGEHAISKKELINLCKNADGLIEFRGIYVLLNPEEAKKLLAAAGAASLEFELAFNGPSAGPANIDAQNAFMVEHWRDVGVTAELRDLPGHVPAPGPEDPPHQPRQ